MIRAVHYMHGQGSVCDTALGITPLMHLLIYPEGRIRLRPHYVVLQMTFATSRKFLNCQDNKRNGHISRYDSRAAGPRSGSYADVRIALTRSWPAGGSRTVQADPAFFLFANVPKRAGVHF